MNIGKTHFSWMSIYACVYMYMHVTQLPSLAAMDAKQTSTASDGLITDPPLSAPPNPPTPQEKGSIPLQRDTHLTPHEHAMGLLSHDEVTQEEPADKNGSENRKSMFAKRHKEMMLTLRGTQLKQSLRRSTTRLKIDKGCWELTCEFLSLQSLVSEGSRFVWDIISLGMLGFSAVIIPAQIVFDHALVNGEDGLGVESVDASAYWVAATAFIFTAHFCVDIFFLLDIVLRYSVFSYDDIEDEVRISASKQTFINTHAFVDTRASQAAKQAKKKKPLLSQHGRRGEISNEKKLSVVPTDHDHIEKTLQTYTSSFQSPSFQTPTQETRNTLDSKNDDASQLATPQPLKSRLGSVLQVPSQNRGLRKSALKQRTSMSTSYALGSTRDQVCERV
jgi:hypothetical protein